jgi:haloacetate dehalogenase
VTKQRSIVHHTALINNIKLHWVVAGEGPPVFLLHGFPEFWYAWRHQIPALAERYTVVVPDLRGYGYSAKPFTGYDKRTMATDIRELSWHLGYERIALVGHDRGARVALRFVKDSPEMVNRMAMLDNVPTVVLSETMDAQYARGYWFFLFNQVPHLPEALITGREEVWLRHFFTEWCYDPQVLTPEDIAEYVRAYHQPGAIMGACNDYRTGPEDIAQDQADRDKRVECPVLALWGEEFEWVGKAFDMEKIWSEFADDLRTVSLPHCAHLPQEERPDEVNRHLLDFLDGWSG